MADWNDIMNMLFGRGALKGAAAQGLPEPNAPPLTPGAAPAPNGRGIFATPAPQVIDMGKLAQQQADLQKAQANIAMPQGVLAQPNKLRKAKPDLTIVIPKGK